ncbi:histidine protein methyltransferase 1-like [Histomonas meleagridis]|uniref:histidine protein methyltransferase 1-like n=1 Tax=Histomonas meleagridis TaxID=135588 RepID=UPI00355A2B63|nr:histidine protein methyltransferase 1-like [Histomonas meleagridis]
MNIVTHEDWEIKTYEGIKSYVPKEGSVPSEVRPGVYEGGFQLWECTIDLLRYLKNINFEGKSVFELGCGRGLPGIYCSLHGSPEVVLQDFNHEVLEEITQPNAKLNDCPRNVITFFSS